LPKPASPDKSTTLPDWNGSANTSVRACRCFSLSTRDSEVLNDRRIERPAADGYGNTPHVTWPEIGTSPDVASRLPSYVFVSPKRVR
jgi:hypothetical protein